MERLVRLYAGLSGFGISLAMMVRARLGVGPWDVLHQGIARQLGVQIGWVVIAMSAVVLLAWIPLRQRPGLGTISNLVLVGLVTNGVLDVLPAPADLWVKILLLASGIALNAVATALYIGAGLGPGPRDGIMTGLAARGHSIRVVRTCIEVSVVAVGYPLGGTVGPGTLAYALLIGPLVHLLIPRLAIRQDPKETDTMTEKKLLLGVNVSTSAAPGADPVADARNAEDLGFDFVSASDHPGSDRPSYETWTLLAWIAAATSRVSVLPRVLGVPFRAPALVAKAAESLDRLSGGRLLLGLGAGGDDSEFRALGLPVRTPAEKVRGLEDAVRIVQGLWSEPSLTYHGTIYRTEEARLEPKPAHRIPIWLGTFGERALEVTGRVADGWIPSRGYVPDEALPAMRARVVAAAEQAGRDPAELTCALNTQVTVDDRDGRQADPFTGPPAKIADSVRRYAELGFTAFNFIPSGADPAGQVDRLAAEVLPALRP